MATTCNKIYKWGFYTQKTRPLGVPFYIHRRDGDPFGMAGLYNLWTSSAGEQVCTGTVITTEQMLEMPSMSRVPTLLATLSPGVIQQDQNQNLRLGAEATCPWHGTRHRP